MTWTKFDLENYISGGDVGIRSGDYYETMLNGEPARYIIQITDKYNRKYGTELYRIGRGLAQSQ